MTRAPIDLLEIGLAGSTFEPLPEPYVANVVYGGQGLPMLEFRLRITGAQAPDCFEQTTTVTQGNSRVGASNTPLRTYLDAGGTRSTKSLFVIIESRTPQTGVMTEVTAEAGGQRVTRSFWIGAIGD